MYILNFIFVAPFRPLWLMNTINSNVMKGLCLYIHVLQADKDETLDRQVKENRPLPVWSNLQDDPHCFGCH